MMPNHQLSLIVVKVLFYLVWHGLIYLASTPVAVAVAEVADNLECDQRAEMSSVEHSTDPLLTPVRPVDPPAGIHTRN